MNQGIFLLLLALAGGLASVIRVLITNWSGKLPYGLILTNSLAAAFVGVVLSGPGLYPQTLAIAMVGVAGGLSTFSGVSKAAFEFWHRGRIMQMIFTLVLNLFLPLVILSLVLQLR